MTNARRPRDRTAPAPPAGCRRRDATRASARSSASSRPRSAMIAATTPTRVARQAVRTAASRGSRSRRAPAPAGRAARHARQASAGTCVRSARPCGRRRVGQARSSSVRAVTSAAAVEATYWARPSWRAAPGPVVRRAAAHAEPGLAVDGPVGQSAQALLGRDARGGTHELFPARREIGHPSDPIAVARCRSGRYAWRANRRRQHDKTGGLAWRQIRRSSRRWAPPTCSPGWARRPSTLARRAGAHRAPPEGKDITEQGGGAAGFHLIRRGPPRSPSAARPVPTWARAATSARSP